MQIGEVEEELDIESPAEVEEVPTAAPAEPAREPVPA